jgi:hypothetical protein
MSNNNPFKVPIHPDCPEMNPSPILFCRSDQHVKDKHTYCAWNLTVTIPHCDANKWTAYFKAPNFITVKGPTISFFEKAEILHDPNCRDADSPVDEAAKKAHVQQEVAIKKEPLRQYKWWEFEIVGVALNNAVLSGSNPSDVIKKNKIALDKEIVVAGVNVTMKGAVLAWTIVEAGGVQTEEDEEEDNDTWIAKWN